MPNITFQPKISSRGRYYYAELLTVAGPQQMGSTGDNSFDTIYGRDYVLVLERETNVLKMYQEDDVVEGEWVEVTTGLASGLFDTALPQDASHITVVTDQSAHPVVAYQTGGAISIWDYDENAQVYQELAGIEGFDPVLLTDALINYRVSGSDIVLFYVKADRKQVYYRLQSDNYGIEYSLLTSEVPLILDRVDTGHRRYQIQISDQYGDKIADGAGSFHSILSTLYDLEVEESMQAIVDSLNDGVYNLVVIKPPLAPDTIISTVGTLNNGGYFLAVITPTLVEEAMLASMGALNEGLYDMVIVTAAPNAETFTGTVSSLNDGLYYNILITRTFENVFNATFGSLQDGSYNAA